MLMVFLKAFFLCSFVYFFRLYVSGYGEAESEACWTQVHFTRMRPQKGNFQTTIGGAISFLRSRVVEVSACLIYIFKKIDVNSKINQCRQFPA